MAWDRDALATGSSSGCGKHCACLCHSHSRCCCPRWPSWSSDTTREEFVSGSKCFFLPQSLPCADSRGGVPQICSLAEDLLLSQYPSMGSRGWGVRLFTSASLAPGSLAGAGLGVKPSFPACVTPTPAPGSIPFGSPFSSTSGESLLPGAPRGETLHQALIRQIPSPLRLYSPAGSMPQMYPLTSLQLSATILAQAPASITKTPTRPPHLPLFLSCP